MCPQNGKYRSYSREDCLYLNIFTPSAESNGFLPVLIWIHGGGFRSGSSALFPVKGIAGNLVSRRVVLVTFNYRLGVMGFYSTREYYAPGNLAFHDQILALNWIRSNIHLFGGDPEKITLFGQGAGSKSVALLSVSPISKGLFRRIILQSGFISQFRSGSTERMIHVCKNISVKLGCAPSSQDWEFFPKMTDVLSCMKQKPFEELLDAAAEMENDVPFEWESIIDGHIIPRPVHELDSISQPPREVVIGLNRDEAGIYFLSPLLSNGTYMAGFTKGKLVSDINDLLKSLSGKNGELVQRLVTSLYADGVQEFFGVDITDDYNYFWLDQDIKLRTEMKFGGPIMRTINSLLHKGSTVYFYQFDYLSPSAFTPSPWRGVVHGWEVPYIFGSSTQFPHDHWNFSLQESDFRMSKIFGILWSNFAKYGNPTPHKLDFTWHPITAEHQSRYLSLKPDLEMKELYSQRSVNFWGRLVPELLQLNIQPDAARVVTSGCFDWIYLWMSLGVLFVLIVFCFVIICLFENQNRQLTHCKL